MSSRSQPFQIRGSLQTLLSLRLVEPHDPEFFAKFLDKIAHSPDFFRNAPIVIDAAPVASLPPIDFAELVSRLREHRIIPVGLQNGSPEWNEAAIAAGLAILPEGRNAEPARAKEAPVAQAGPAAKAASPALLITEPVRGGQQIYAPDGDIVVVGQVGHGAELIAGGHIHVYGSLRGRAFAGIDGDESAMIFCDQLDAELLSIAGIHMVSEQFDERVLKKRAKVACDGEKLVVTALS
ncbi:MAG TPA: septum site-determining protein MinC [Geminicoccus sp.]|uniref:septum site-determining protein MinC n=1 Tax=Geminicoccus sp. TaxID=2024832 RepID=UPI002BC5340E|nr:septum site-determining protein MinC [Geminicoccus sp.]HWL68121.1 septum site-determining protein MinC [Geminicoccus sp.]